MNNDTKTMVNLNGKDYTVRSRTDASGRVEWSIFIEYEAFDLASRNFCRQAPIWRIRHVDPDGRLGRAILRTLAASKVAHRTALASATIEDAAAMMAGIS